MKHPLPLKFDSNDHADRSLRRGLIQSVLLTAALSLAGSSLPANAGHQDDDDDASAINLELAQTGRYCSRTASALLQACEYEAADDIWKAGAGCLNVSDKVKRLRCFADAKAARDEKKQLCRAQFDERRDACKLLGEDRYDPPFNQSLFDTDFTHLAHPNRYFPLTIGHLWEYAGGDQTNTVEVTSETKLINGVRCIVVRDKVFVDGELHENTDDWYVQAKNGNVWYCGEEVKDFESFDGDNPRLPELVSIDGSFKAGRNGDKPGIIFRAVPTAGASYLEEFSLGNAEDVTQILSTTYRYGSNRELDQLVPPQLAKLLCAGDCVVTKNFSLLEPDVFARKYYAPGIGAFLEVESEGMVSQLVNCNFDPRCARLPKP